MIPLFVDPSGRLFALPGDDPAAALRWLHDAAETLGFRRVSLEISSAGLPHYALPAEAYARGLRLAIFRPCAAAKAATAAVDWAVAIAAGRLSFAETSSVAA